MHSLPFRSAPLRGWLRPNFGWPWVLALTLARRRSVLGSDRSALLAWDAARATGERIAAAVWPIKAREDGSRRGDCLAQFQPHTIAAGAVVASTEEDDAAILQRALQREQVGRAHRGDAVDCLGTLDR